MVDEANEANEAEYGEEGEEADEILSSGVGCLDVRVV